MVVALAVAGIARIQVRSVTCTYGTTVALRRVSASFEAGVATFIEGPNGAGKSTLLAVLGTLVQPRSGTVDFEPLGHQLERVRLEIGWVGHESRCYRELTARDNVELAARLYGVEVRPAWEAVAQRVGLAEIAEQPVGTLSRGQRQRVALARALVHRPSVLLLDEPVTGLDSASLERLDAILCAERDRGAVVVVVSHDAGMRERIGGASVRLVRGRVAS